MHLQDRVLEAVEMVEQKGNALALEQASSPNAKEGGVGYYRVQMLYLQVRMSEYPGVPPLGVPSEYPRCAQALARPSPARHAAWAQAALCLARVVLVQ